VFTGLVEQLLLTHEVSLFVVAVMVQGLVLIQVGDDELSAVAENGAQSLGLGLCEVPFAAGWLEVQSNQ
jgi:hypothetical protein